MSELRRLQQGFQRHLLEPGGVAMPEIVARDGPDAQARLDIYTTAYRMRLVEALEANYPKLAAWLGEEEFARLGRAYLAEQPSVYRSIRYFGDRLAEFLARIDPWRRHGEFTKMARLEWTLAAAFDAADAPHASPEQMQALPPKDWPVARFVPHPSVRCIELEWNVVQIWKALDQGERPPPAQHGEARSWVIWRRDLQTRFQSLTPAEAKVLEAILAGRPFAELCEGLCEHHPESEVPGRAAALIGQWLKSGLIGEIRL